MTTQQQLTAGDAVDDQRKAVEDRLAEFEYLDDRVGEAAFDLKYGDMELPRGIRRDLEEITGGLMRVKYWLEDQLHKLIV
jgi:hypothetical protein